jgi:hypothetical protein
VTGLKGAAVLLLLLLSSPANSFLGAHHFSGTTRSPYAWHTFDLTAFGNSIAAGYQGLFSSRIKSYVDYFASMATRKGEMDRLPSQIDYEGFTHSGYTTLMIYEDILDHFNHRWAIRSSDIITLEAGGNDFLEARDNYADSCDERELDKAIEDWKQDWDILLAYIVENILPFAIVRTMRVYYPGVNKDKRQFCGNKSHFEAFLPRLLRAGDYICKTSKSFGILCANAIAAMNCHESESGVDPFCPTSEFHLENPEFELAAFQDPSEVTKYRKSCKHTCSKKKGKRTCKKLCQPKRLRATNLIQDDDTHPTAWGHFYIAIEHAKLGF